jgi:hypothetical protein
MLAEWRLYFENLLNNKTVNPQTLSIIPPPARIDLNIDSSNIKRWEIKAAVQSLKNNKAPGTDQIVTAATLKHGGDFLLNLVHEVCQAVYSGFDPPWQWTTNSIVPVPKKGDRSKMTNYRASHLCRYGPKYTTEFSLTASAQCWTSFSARIKQDSERAEAQLIKSVLFVTLSRAQIENT